MSEPRRLGFGGAPGKRGPRPLAGALEGLRAEVAPQTLLAAVQEAWPAAVGPGVAAQAEPVAEREGVVRVACRTATWAQELDLMQDELLMRLREELEPTPLAAGLQGLRFGADAARSADQFPSGAA